MPQKLKDLHNMHALTAVIAGLGSHPVYRLAELKAALPARDERRLAQLRLLVGGDENHRRARALLAARPLPCLPHLGPYLVINNALLLLLLVCAACLCVRV